MMNEQLNSVKVDDWVLKTREPEVIDGAPVVVLLHGWTGDENSMWVFARELSEDALIIAPRGLFPSQHREYAGFSWVVETTEKWATRSAFDLSVNQLDNLFVRLAKVYPANFKNIYLAGFSQGAALAGVYTLTNPDRVKRLALLSGFLPADLSPGEADLEGLNIFIGHGSLDEIVPEEKAQEALLYFQASGALVNYCLTEVGHKLGKDCFRGFNQFFMNL